MGVPLIRLFPNLFPEEPRTLVQRSRLNYNDGKWRIIMPNGITRTASGVYNFVTREKIIFVGRANAKVGSTLIGHADLALGREVEYAGRLYFSGRRNRGILRKWTNESGHYRPDPNYIAQASLPIDFFEMGKFDGLASIGTSSNNSVKLGK